jgi:hypothetical protein
MRRRIHAYIRGSRRGAEGRAATDGCGSESLGRDLVRVFLLFPGRRIHACH